MEAGGLGGAPGAADGYRLEAVADLRGVDALAGAWDDLWGRSGSPVPFTRFGWNRAWWESFGGESPFTVWTVRATDGTLAALLPTLPDPEAKRPGVLRVWANTHSFRSALLWDPAHPGALLALARGLRHLPGWWMLRIPYLVADDPAVAALRAAFAGEGMGAVTWPIMASPVYALQGTWEEALGSLSRRRRESLRRKQRQLLEGGKGRVEIVRGTVPDLGARLAQCWAVSAHTWKHRQGSSIAADPRRVAFYEGVGAADKEWLVLALLHLDGEPVAFEYNLLCRGVLYSLKLGFDERFAKASPGIVLRMKVLEWAFANGVATFDYMGNEADYKDMLSTYVLAHENLELFNANPRGRAAHFAKGRAYPAARAVYRAGRRLLGKGRP